jgi:hypothetical protein
MACARAVLYVDLCISKQQINGWIPAKKSENAINLTDTGVA